MIAKKPDKRDYFSWNIQKYSEDSLAWETNPLYGWCNKKKKVDGSYFNL
jgi:penicillin-binding protein 1A